MIVFYFLQQCTYNLQYLLKDKFWSYHTYEQRIILQNKVGDRITSFNTLKLNVLSSISKFCKNQNNKARYNNWKSIVIFVVGMIQKWFKLLIITSFLIWDSGLGKSFLLAAAIFFSALTTLSCFPCISSHLIDSSVSLYMIVKRILNIIFCFVYWLNKYFEMHVHNYQ